MLLACTLCKETEAKVIRGEACVRLVNKRQGFIPEIICAHPGWENPVLMIFGLEFPYFLIRNFIIIPVDWIPSSTEQGKTGLESFGKNCMKMPILIFLDSSAWNITPTSFRRSTFPYNHQIRMSTIHDGVDTSLAAPLSKPELTLADGPTLRKGDRIVTFVNQQGPIVVATFIRSIPFLQRLVPDSTIVIVGATTVLVTVQSVHKVLERSIS